MNIFLKEWTGSISRILLFTFTILPSIECWYYSTGVIDSGQVVPSAYANFHQSPTPHHYHHSTPTHHQLVQQHPTAYYSESSEGFNDLGYGLPLGRTALYIRLPTGVFVPVKAVYALPPFLERLVQRVQGYYSVYNPPDTLTLNRPPVPAPVPGDDVLPGQGGPAVGAPAQGELPIPGVPVPGFPIPSGPGPLPTGPGGSLPGPLPIGPPLIGGIPPGPLGGAGIPPGAGVPPGTGVPPPRPDDPDVSLNGPPQPDDKPPVTTESTAEPTTPPGSTESDVEEVTETSTEAEV